MFTILNSALNVAITIGGGVRYNYNYNITDNLKKCFELYRFCSSAIFSHYLMSFKFLEKRLPKCNHKLSPKTRFMRWRRRRRRPELQNNNKSKTDREEWIVQRREKSNSNIIQWYRRCQLWVRKKKKTINTERKEKCGWTAIRRENKENIEKMCVGLKNNSPGGEFYCELIIIIMAEPKRMLAKRETKVK